MEATTWRCLHCGHELADGEDCLLPDCMEARASSRERMGVNKWAHWRMCHQCATSTPLEYCPDCGAAVR